MDLQKEYTVVDCLHRFHPDVVVHAAAVANAAVCESSRAKAFAVNVTGTERLMKSLPNRDVLAIYISTDLVFDGLNAPYRESDRPQPISFYGETKRMAEQITQRMAPNHIILRPALIFGQPTASGRGSFVQWMDKALSQDGETDLFLDEFRTPVYVHDIVNAVRALMERTGRHRIYHVGGPERITRVEFARRLCALRGHDPAKINPVLLKDVDTGYPRAVDVSLDCARIGLSHGLHPTPIAQALGEIFPSV